MAHGTYEEMKLDDPSFRQFFDREAVLRSDWYQQRLRVKQERDTALWRRHVAAVEEFQQAGAFPSTVCDFNIEERGREARAQLAASVLLPISANCVARSGPTLSWVKSSARNGLKSGQFSTGTTSTPTRLRERYLFRIILPGCLSDSCRRGGR